MSAIAAYRTDHTSRHEWFAQSGLRPEYRDVGHRAYTERLCRYIADPSTVRVRVLERYGIAPGIETIRRIRAEWLALVRHRAEKSYDYGIRAHEMKEPARPERSRREAPARPVVATPTPAPIAAPVEEEPRQYCLTTPSDVINAVASICGVTHGEIVGTLRFKPIIRARNLAAAILFARGNSRVAVGKRLGGRDHSTICNSLAMFFGRDISEPRLLDAWTRLAPEPVRHVRELEDLLRVMGEAA